MFRKYFSIFEHVGKELVCSWFN